MKRVLSLILLLFIIFPLVSCNLNDGSKPNKNEELVVTEDNVIETQVELKDTSTTNEGRQTDRVVYNEHDLSKNLLLQFLHDEIPIVNYNNEGDVVYYSDLVDVNENLETSKFFIVDMDGNGNDEYGYFHHPMLDIIKYNEEKEYFELWISVKSQQRPIGNGKMYAITTSQPIIYEYYLYDENANLIESSYYRTGEEYDKEKEVPYKVYEINDKYVSEETWNVETEYLFNLIEEAPKPLGYQELLE